jgi:hypothetical protein
MKNPPKTSEKLTTLVFGLQTKMTYLETENKILRENNHQKHQGF